MAGEWLRIVDAFWAMPRSTGRAPDATIDSMRKIAKGMLCLGIAMVLAAAVGCTKLPPPTPLAELNPQQTHGYQVYQQRCAECHNDRTNEPLNGQSLRGIFKKQYLESGAPANDDRVMDAIVYGRPMMPAVGSRMTPQERDDLLAYLHTL
jgi:mono/diheme cytochrome c family protein